MTYYVMRYVLACGHNSGRVETTEANKRKPGDTWDCDRCGTSQKITRSEGRIR